MRLDVAYCLQKSALRATAIPDISLRMAEPTQQEVKATIRFKNATLKAEYEKLTKESGGLISLNALLELALQEALPAIRRKIKALKK